jgi:hypothetical protein
MIAKASVLGLGLVLAAATPAAAAPGDDGLTVVPENGTPGRLSLTSDPYPVEFPPFRPGVTRWWQIGAHLRGEPRADLVMHIESSGPLVTAPDGLVVESRTCTAPWRQAADEPPSCPATVADVLPPIRLAEAPTLPIPLGPITPSRSVWVLVSLHLPDDAGDQLQGQRGRIAVGFTASGDAVPTSTATPTTTAPTAPLTTTPGPAPLAGPPTAPGTPGGTPMPRTGATVLPSLLAAVGAVGAGLTLARLAHRRSRAGSRQEVRP